MYKGETQEDVSVVRCVDSVSRTLFNVELFVLQNKKCGGHATSEGEASASSEETDPLLQDDVDWHTSTQRRGVVLFTQLLTSFHHFKWRKKLSLSALVNENSALLRNSETLDGNKCLNDPTLETALDLFGGYKNSEWSVFVFDSVIFGVIEWWGDLFQVCTGQLKCVCVEYLWVPAFAGQSQALFWEAVGFVWLRWLGQGLAFFPDLSVLKAGLLCKGTKGQSSSDIWVLVRLNEVWKTWNMLQMSQMQNNIKHFNPS